MQVVYFVVAAVALYLLSDLLLHLLERWRGRRFEEHRSIVFFAILLVLALVTFALVRHVVGS